MMISITTSCIVFTQEKDFAMMFKTSPIYKAYISWLAFPSTQLGN